MNQVRKFKEPLNMIPCSDCAIGQMRQTTVTWFTFLEDRMITVPDFPAWVCDMCGNCEYDLNALDNLATLLYPQDAPRPVRRRARTASKTRASLPKASPASED
jgi:YgiT-type zinc finger domain-containing protein